MQVGNRVFFYIDKALKDRRFYRNSGGKAYHRITGKIIKTFKEGQRLTAIDIEHMFDVSPGCQKFNNFYNSPHKTKRAVMETREGVCYLFTEIMWTKKTLGDARYVEIVPNSVAFLLDN